MFQEHELMQSFYCKWHKVAQAFTVVVYVKEMTAKKSSKYGKYGLFEHSLFLFIISVVLCAALSRIGTIEHSGTRSSTRSMALDNI